MQRTTIEIETNGGGLYEVTDDVARFVADGRDSSGLVHLFLRHTSASLLIQENADPDVRRDLQTFFTRLVPEGMAWITHTTEGPDDMPAHIKAALTQTALTIPIEAGRLLLGRWQGIYLFEHRSRPHSRQVILSLSD
ncbi:secondary thiamine-phosphate synthase enzyme YjbQ [Pararhizobium haloflavum]|uniref:secondary thiamine-phosphate synthase enzyme YjbQ n=1 Tax=Pararhizobium haloflavum TaxID=2037914 RepID=UPI000C19C3C3|nr:secondary thiamine-phosphate synthase enzyme YjbQ [Pararhizobium haloflavum]